MLKHALEHIWEHTGEVGYVKIVYTERVQDGVERLGYAVGLEAVKAVQKQEAMIWKVSEVSLRLLRSWIRRLKKSSKTSKTPTLRNAN